MSDKPMVLRNDNGDDWQNHTAHAPRSMSLSKNESSEVWLDDMPAFPLARSVPVVLPADKGRPERRGVITAVLGEHGRTCRVTWNDGTHDVAISSYLRVDLDDNQGFAFALRRADRHLRNGQVSVWRQDYGSTLDEHMANATSDKRRVLLARALSRSTDGVKW